MYRDASGRPAVTYDTGTAWASGALPGLATDVLGTAAFPADSQPDRVFLADGGAMTANSASAPAGPAGPWTAAPLPATAATFAVRVLLYAATAAQTPQRAAGLAYYAVHGHFPAGVTALPAAAYPSGACSGQPTP